MKYEYISMNTSKSKRSVRSFSSITFEELKIHKFKKVINYNYNHNFK